MKPKFLKASERREILRELEDNYGIGNVPSVLVESGKEKIRAFEGSMTREELKELAEVANVEVIGLYLFKRESQGLRLSLDATHVFSEQISKGILDLDDKNAEAWMKGQDLELECEKGFVVLRNNEALLGCGISNGEKVFNYIQKERRIRKS